MELSKDSDDMTFRAGVTRLDNRGVVPNSGMDRTSINLRSTAKMSDWLSIDMKVTRSKRSVPYCGNLTHSLSQQNSSSMCYHG